MYRTIGEAELNQIKAAGPAGQFAGANKMAEPGLIERSACVASGLKALHGKLSAFNDRLEGGASAQAGQSVPTQSGLRYQLSETETVLIACHSLLDDIAGKF